MCLIRSERRFLCIMDEIIALRGQRPQNVWASGSLVVRYKAVSHHQLARAVDSTVPDATATLPAGIAINGAKDHFRLGTETTVENTAPGSLGHILRDRAIDQRERPDTSVDVTGLERQASNGDQASR